jgi:hypothetical protein
VGGLLGRGSRRACTSASVLVHDGRGEGGADRAVPRRNERESGRAGVMVRSTEEAGPRGRGARGRRQLAPIARPSG